VDKGDNSVNPSGPYPGRQLFIGITQNGNPCVAYLVTGRSPASRERKAVLTNNGIIIGPIGNQPYDPLRHYTGLKHDNSTGIIAVSNGIQTEAIFETYKLLFNTNSNPAKDIMEKLLDGAQAEPDSLHTPRIAGTVTYSPEGKLVLIAGIKCNAVPARAFYLEQAPGILTGVSTYKGSLENPAPFDVETGLSKIEFKGKTPIELAEHLFEISKATYNEEDIRVCAVAGIRSEDKQNWQIAMRNR
jgi:IMP cyclohydrolase